MAHKRKNPVADGTPGSAGRNFLTGKGASSQKARAVQSLAKRRNQPDIEAIWDACREALDADASRKAQADAKLQSAAQLLGFAKSESGTWEGQCPQCRRKVGLFVIKNGDVLASQSDIGLTCSSIASLQQWLRDRGFQS